MEPLVRYRPVPRLHSPDASTVHRDFLKKNQPVVVTGWLDDWPVRKNWTLPYLKERLGDIEVEVRHKTNTAAYRQGSTYFTKKLKFSVYVEELEKGTKRARDQYLAVQNIHRAFPPIANEFQLPIFVPKIHRGPFLWIAPAGHFEYLHIDPDDNFLLILSGSKTVRLFSPDQLQKLYPNPLGAAGYSLQTQVDLSQYFGHEHEPEAVAAFVHQFPKFRDMECHECTIRDGEVLFLPFGYWHQVTSTEVTISVNCFCGDATGDFLPKIMADGPIWDTFKYWMLNIIEQNRCMSTNEAFTFCSRRYSQDQLQDCLQKFLWTRYKEELTDQLLDKMIQAITEYCDMQDHRQWPSSGTFDEMAAMVKPALRPPRIKIRGKNWRGGDK